MTIIDLIVSATTDRIKQEKISPTIEIGNVLDELIRERNIEIPDDKHETALKRIQDNWIRHCSAERNRGLEPLYIPARGEPDVLVKNERALGDSSRTSFEPHLVNTISGMGWTRFEHLCTYLLVHWGARSNRSFRTPNAKDGGIDFGAEFDIAFAVSPYQVTPRRVRIIGQAKHRSSSDGVVNLSDMKEFLFTYISLFMDRANTESLPTWFYESPNPILGVFVTNGIFANDGQLLKEWGILAYDGKQLARDLLRSQHWQHWCDEKGVFQTTRFFTFIDQASNRN